MLGLFKSNIESIEVVEKRECEDKYIKEDTCADIVDNDNHNSILKPEMKFVQMPSGNKSEDLMRLVGMAIDEWSSYYNMKGIPKKIVLGQVLALLNTWYKDMQ